jgi:Ribbon-Helix-Helix transcriptional regulator family
MSIVQELWPKVADSEKITLNLGYVDLGHIDVMVQEGSTPTERTLFVPLSAISSTAMPT